MQQNFLGWLMAGTAFGVGFTLGASVFAGIFPVFANLVRTMNRGRSPEAQGE